MQRTKRKQNISASDSVTRSEPFSAVVRKGADGNNKLHVLSERWYAYALNKRFKDGEKVTLELHTRRSKRTVQQNKFYWGVYLPLIAEETGEKNLDRLHELFKGMFLTEGVVDVLGKKVRMKKSTTELGKMEFCEYIMAIEGETGVEAPPTENYGLEALTK